MKKLNKFTRGVTKSIFNFLSFMNFIVIRLGKNDQIFWSVIVFNSVNMMHKFMRKKFSTKNFFHHFSMLSYISFTIPNLDIIITFSSIDTTSPRRMFNVFVSKIRIEAKGTTSDRTELNNFQSRFKFFTTMFTFNLREFFGIGETFTGTKKGSVFSIFFNQIFSFANPTYFCDHVSRLTERSLYVK